MTETNLTPVVPDGVDAIEGLTVGELDGLCNALGCDVASTFDDEAPQSVQGKKYAALALLAHRWARRADHAAKLDTYRAMSFGELSSVLRLTDDDGQGGDDDPTANPTESAPA
jgi:hypothetical protein